MGKNKSLTEQEMIELLRSDGQKFLSLPNVTSVGVGYKIKGGKRTKELCIQFTVEKKISLEGIQAEGLVPLPTSMSDSNGTRVPVDVLERSYKPHYEVMRDPEQEAMDKETAPWKNRRSRLDPVIPGISVSNINGTAGTFGAIVYDEVSGQPYILSNWHVLHGPSGNPGDSIVQPGPYDGGTVDENLIGKLVRSHLGLAGDCAIASIEGRNFEEEILELNVSPKRAAKVNLDDKVVKSGRTTGVTYGIVQRVGVVVNINYGGTVGSQQVGGFEIGPNPAKLPDNGEISMGGDSGSLWLIDGEKENDIAVGLHFAGETNPDPAAEHAIACNIHSVLEKLNVSFVTSSEHTFGDEDLWNELLARMDLLSMRVAVMEKKGCACKDKAGQGETSKALTETSSAISGRLAAQEGIPIYGNWCGPGHGGGNPLDDVDRACMTHDKCYSSRGYFDCECDAQLLRDLDRAIAFGNVRPWGRVMGPAIRAWFSLQPCVPHISGGITVKKVMRAGKSVWKKIWSVF